MQRNHKSKPKNTFTKKEKQECTSIEKKGNHPKKTKKNRKRENIERTGNQV